MNGPATYPEIIFIAFYLHSIEAENNFSNICIHTHCYNIPFINQTLVQIITKKSIYQTPAEAFFFFFPLTYKCFRKQKNAWLVSSPVMYPGQGEEV